MRSLLLVLSMLMLTGCAVSPHIHPVSGIEKSAAVGITDLRPASEKQSEIFSFMITNDAYGILRMGEDRTDPTVIRLLQHRAHEKFGVNAPMTIKVHHLVTYLNQKSAMKRGAVGWMFAGPVGMLVANRGKPDEAGVVSGLVDQTAFNSLASEEYKRGYFKEEDNPQNASVQITYIDVEINGKRKFTRTMASRPFGSDANAAMPGLEAAIKYHLMQHE